MTFRLLVFIALRPKDRLEALRRFMGTSLQSVSVGRKGSSGLSCLVGYRRKKELSTFLKKSLTLQKIFCIITLHSLEKGNIMKIDGKNIIGKRIGISINDHVWELYKTTRDITEKEAKATIRSTMKRGLIWDSDSATQYICVAIKWAQKSPH